MIVYNLSVITISVLIYCDNYTDTAYFLFVCLFVVCVCVCVFYHSFRVGREGVELAQ